MGGSGSMERVRERCVLAYERDKDGMGRDARRERARAAFVANLTTATTHERERAENTRLDIFDQFGSNLKLQIFV